MIDSTQILERLIAFPTVSRTPNTELIEYVRELLKAAGIANTLIPSADGKNANLHARVGPDDEHGVMLSGHTDVVPAKDQRWTVDPFVMTTRNGRFYGRGTADMKGFVACAVRAMLKAKQSDLRVPLQLALSYDEEIGCVGVRRMLDMLDSAPCKPSFCIVGEPTELKVATGHKGKTALKATCIGKETHSALAPFGFNAIHLACDFINLLRRQQSALQTHGARDGDYEVPYSTIHVGVINGGTALNIVPGQCTVDFEIRNLPEDDPELILNRIRVETAELMAQTGESSAETEIRIEITNAYPGLDTRPEAEVVAFVKSLTGEDRTFKVPFGTEGGLFRERMGVSTVICGPGSMEQGHKPDEFVSREQIERCDAMMDKLVEALSAR